MLVFMFSSAVEVKPCRSGKFMKHMLGIRSVILPCRSICLLRLATGRVARKLRPGRNFAVKTSVLTRAASVLD